MKALRPLQPTIVLVALTVVLIGMITIVRAISSGAGFLIERQVVLLAWLAGLVIAGAVFTWVARRSLRRDSPSVWWMMPTVLVLALPLALALLQQPAP